MTDNDLQTLLLDAAHDLSVPPAPTHTVLARGRTLRRRRRAIGAVTTSAALVLAAAATLGVLTAGGGPMDESRHRMAASHLRIETGSRVDGLSSTSWAMWQGRRVYTGDGITATAPGDIAEVSLTSVGSLVSWRPSADDRVVLRHTLVAEDGTTTEVDLPGDVSAAETGPSYATDPARPYVAYVAPARSERPARGGTVDWLLVVRDVRTGEVVGKVSFTDRRQVTPPSVWLHGDRAYVHSLNGGSVLAVAWRTGVVRTTPGERSFPEISGDRLLEVDEGTHRARVVDLRTGRTVLSAPAMGGQVEWELSGDGSHLLGESQQCDRPTCADPYAGAVVYDVDTGAAKQVGGPYARAGWSSDGKLVLAYDRRVRVCDPDTLACSEGPTPLGAAGSILVTGDQPD